MIDYLIFKLKNTLKKQLNFFRINLNIQHPGMEGQTHTDGGSLMTCLYMVKGEGGLELDNQMIQFEKDKLIVFDSALPHKGIAPTKGPRVTLAFKINELK